MSQLRFLILGMILLGVIGCSKSNQEVAEQQPPKPVQPVAEPAPPPAAQEPATPVTEPAAAAPRTAVARKPTEKPKVEKKTAPVQTAQSVTPGAINPEPAAAPSANAVVPDRQEVATPPPPKPPEPKIFTIPDGTVLHVRLQDALDSGMNKSGDTFSALLDQDLTAEGNIVVPRGSVLTGKLSHVAQSGRVEGRASMALQLTGLSTAGRTYSIQTEILSFEAESTTKKDAAKVGIGAGLGAVIGAIAGGGKGAAIGAAVGGGAGGAAVIATRGKEVQLEREHPLSFVLAHTLRIQLQ
jgi:hypothetical protein